MASKNGKKKLGGPELVEAIRSAGGIVGVMEAAEIVGVERSRFARWLTPLRKWRRPPNNRQGPMPELPIPQPIDDLACGPVWLRSEMEEFAATFSRRRHQAASST